MKILLMMMVLLGSVTSFAQDNSGGAAEDSGVHAVYGYGVGAGVFTVPMRNYLYNTSPFTTEISAKGGIAIRGVEIGAEVALAESSTFYVPMYVSMNGYINAELKGFYVNGSFHALAVPSTYVSPEHNYTPMAALELGKVINKDAFSKQRLGVYVGVGTKNGGFMAGVRYTKTIRYRKR